MFSLLPHNRHVIIFGISPLKLAGHRTRKTVRPLSSTMQRRTNNEGHHRWRPNTNNVGV